ncbi:MAG: glycine--tRNA ligase [Candidatus Thermoplasmatota archaeon]|nr:glycine--tRNA ligase [Candidatus Thermoplasmatota archaeon]
MDVYSQIISLAKRRGIFHPSYEIYGGEAGFYDYGPLGALLRHNVQNLWREFYVLGEQCMEISTPVIAPYEVLKASGHVDKFLDVVVTCRKCRSAFKAEELSEEQLQALECPSCGGPLEKGRMNLMFETEIGAVNRREAFLRPETAQGIFVNFPLLYQYARRKLPFGVVQVGRGFRNEVSPRQGLYRLREFSMAEAEIFFDPEDKTHPRFGEVAGDQVNVIPAGGEELRSSVGRLMEEGIINNQALAYYLALTQRFLLAAGIDPAKLRFRQHQREEMAHYARDCWDAEIHTALGWIECVGIADRTAYDLTAHMQATGADMTAFRAYGEPVKEKRRRIVPDMAKLGPAFKDRAKDIVEQLERMEPPPEESALQVTLEGERVMLDPEFFEVVEEEVTVTGKNVIPHVIEPSYGIDRIIYSILEHNYVEAEKEGERYVSLQLPPSIAPVTAGVFPLVSKDGLPQVALDLDRHLRERGIMTFYDEAGSIGRRYARMDEIGTPFCVTVDHTTLEDDTVTVRFRDTTEQVRVPRRRLAAWIDENIRPQ